MRTQQHTHCAVRGFCVLQVFTYDGRQVCALKPQGLGAEGVSRQLVSLSNDTMAVAVGRSVHCYETAQGRAVGDAVNHGLEVKAVCLSQVGAQGRRGTDGLWGTFGILGALSRTPCQEPFVVTQAGVSCVLAEASGTTAVNAPPRQTSCRCRTTACWPGTSANAAVAGWRGNRPPACCAGQQWGPVPRAAATQQQPRHHARRSSGSSMCGCRQRQHSHSCGSHYSERAGEPRCGQSATAAAAGEACRQREQPSSVA